MSTARVGVDSSVEAVFCAAVLHVGAFQGCFLDLTSEMPPYKAACDLC
jgi:hypothetical protein